MLKPWAERVMHGVEGWHCEESPEKTSGENESTAQLQHSGDPSILETPAPWD